MSSHNPPRWTLFACVALLAWAGTIPVAGQVYFTEDFEALELEPPVDESIPADDPREFVWSPDGPEGWSVDRSQVPAGGVTEWRGWNFVDPVWWSESAGDQGRATFASEPGNFVIAVADGDEWDDASHDPGLMNTTLSTPPLPIVGGRTTLLEFDSSWQAEAPQTASLRATFDVGGAVELLNWSSDPGDENFYGDAPAERLELPVDAPAGATEVTFHFNYEAGNNWWWAIDNLNFGSYEETFEDVELGENVNEGRAIGLPFDPEATWTPEPPAGWSVDSEDLYGIDDDGVGVTEWKGWSFANKDFWATVAGDQTRTLFEKGEGTIAIADPDEWDDQGNPAGGGTWNSFVTTEEFSIEGAEPGTLTLTFDSSWRPYADSTGTVTATYDDGTREDVLLWTSGAGDETFHPDSQNETVTLPLNNPAGATSMSLTFGLEESGNDWWWALDNIIVSAGDGPTTAPGDFNNDGVLDVNDADILTMQVAAGSTDPAFDVNGDSAVNADDIAMWSTDLRRTYLGDANVDGEFNSSDLVTLFAAGTYEMDADAVWSQGDFNGDGRFTSGDLVAALADGGYEQGARSAVAAVPEPSTFAVLLVGLLPLVPRRRRS